MSAMIGCDLFRSVFCFSEWGLHLLVYFRVIGSNIFRRTLSFIVFLRGFSPFSPRVKYSMPFVFKVSMDWLAFIRKFHGLNG